MSRSAIEHATNEFYAWEQLGRGTGMAEAPIELEPCFTPFFFHTRPSQQYQDDSHRHTFLSWAWSALRGRPQPPMQPDPEPVGIEYFPDTADDALAVLMLTFPIGFKAGLNEMEQCLLMLTELTPRVSFEIVATASAITFQIACAESDAHRCKQQLQMFFPSLQVEVSDQVDGMVADEMHTAIVDFGLKEEFMRPLSMYRGSDGDSLTSIFGVLEHLHADEQATIQILFSPTLNDWSSSILRAVTDNEGGPFFEDAPEMVQYAKEKVSHPLFAVTVRCVTQAVHPARTHALMEHLAMAVMHATRSSTNSLVPLFSDAYSFIDLLDDMLLRQSRRAGMLVNSRELLALVHFPAPSISSQKLARVRKKTKAAPMHILGVGITLGTNTHDGQTVEVQLPEVDRYKHTHIIGSTGTGKSTLVLQMALQDITAGKGICALDPHGDLVDAILSRIPSERAADVILVDPANADFPIGLNILSNTGTTQPDVLAADITAVFRRLSSSWGDQMNSVLSNAILAFLDNTRTGTLIDLRRFLIEKAFRNRWLETVTDPSTQYYWQHEYPLLKTSSIGPILTRLDTFLRPKQVRHMVAQQKMLDFSEIIDGQKIVLAKLSQGLIGTENSYLLGTVLGAKIHQAVLAQQAKGVGDRSSFFLYVDEFQHFITPSMAAMLSGVRKYKLGLILAHQDLQQLQRYDSELLNAMLTNVYTRICFRLGDADAKKLAEGFSYFDTTDLKNLETGEALVRVGRPEHDFNITTTNIPTHNTNLTEQITARSQAQYGTPRATVEAYINEQLGTTNAPSIPEPEPAPKDEPEAPTQAEPPRPVVQLPPEPAQAPTSTPEADAEMVNKRAARHEQGQHRYLQQLIKKISEANGYTATIEAGLKDGSGRVDVALERGSERIACEVSVTTAAPWELHNVEKCLADGYTKVFCCAENEKVLRQLEKKLRPLISETLKDRVFFVDPVALARMLAPVSAQQQNTTVIKGRRIVTQYGAPSAEEIAQKQRLIQQLAMRTIKKGK
jgi:hypothetical protein